MNKAIRKEARATFWSLAKFDLEPRGRSQDNAAYTYCNFDYFSIFERSCMVLEMMALWNQEVAGSRLQRL
jgi:hypothetical protein